MEYKAQVTLANGKKEIGEVRWFRDGKVSLKFEHELYGVYEEHEVEWIGPKPEMVPPLHLRGMDEEEMVEWVQGIRKTRENLETKKKAKKKATPKTKNSPKTRSIPKNVQDLPLEERLKLAEELGLL